MACRSLGEGRIIIDEPLDTLSRIGGSGPVQVTPVR
jgi:hypothetical protein